MQNKKVFIFIVEHEYLEPKVKSTKKSDEFSEHKIHGISSLYAVGEIHRRVSGHKVFLVDFWRFLFFRSFALPLYKVLTLDKAN